MLFVAVVDSAGAAAAVLTPAGCHTHTYAHAHASEYDVTLKFPATMRWREASVQNMIILPGWKAATQESVNARSKQASTQLCVGARRLTALISNIVGKCSRRNQLTLEPVLLLWGMSSCMWRSTWLNLCDAIRRNTVE